MTSRQIWSHGSGTSLRDLLASCCSALLLDDTNDQAAYFSSPWMSNFVLFQNPFGEWESLFPDIGEQVELRFTDFLAQLSLRRQVRIIVVDNSTSRSFAENSNITNQANIEIRFAPETYHEKGILTSAFYLEGSMNLTYSGVCRRDEKVVFHPQSGNEEKTNLAYLQFNRFWDTLEG